MCVAVVGGCGGASTPVAPTPNVATSPALLKAGMTVESLLTSSGGYQYAIQIEVSESAGVAATLECVGIYGSNWEDPLATVCGADAWPHGNVVPAGGVVQSKSVVIEELFPYEYYVEFFATVAFRDGAGSKSFLTTARAPSIPQPPPGAKFGLTGNVVEQGTGQPLGDVTVQVVGGKNAGRKATTDIDGRYTFTGLEPERLSVQLSRAAYKESGTWVELMSNRTLYHVLARD